MESEPPAWAFEAVHLVPADPRWAARAEQFAAEVGALFDGWLSSPVEHVGSTAIAGLAAKPIIDLQATADDPVAAVAAEREKLTAGPWFLVPRDLDQRPWRWFIVRADDSGHHRLAHFHLMRSGEPRWDDQLRFRDVLRANRDLAGEYARLKAAAAEKHRQDREAYTEAKYAFVRRILGNS